MPEQPQDKQGGAKQEKGRPHHVADDPVGEVEAEDPTVQSPTTDSGLPVEEQIHKEWDPKKSGGLPTFLRPGLRARRNATR